VYGRQVFYQLALVQQYVIYDGGARLGDDGLGVFSLDIPDVRPCANIGAQGHVVYLPDAHFFEPSEYAVAVYAADTVRGRREQRYLNAVFQIVKEPFGVVLIIARAVLARPNARAAGYAPFVIDPDLYLTVGFICDAGPFYRADAHAPVATDACGFIV